MDVQIVDIGSHSNQQPSAQSVVQGPVVWDCIPGFLSSELLRQETSPVSTKFFQRFFCESLRDGRKWTARCVLCSAVVSAAAGVNSNFKRHLRRYHPVELELFEVSRNLGKSTEHRSQEDVPSSSISYSANASNNSNGSVVDIVSSPDQNSTNLNDAGRKHDIDDAVLVMLCINSEPFNFVESEGFRHFLKVALPWYEAPTVENLCNTLLPAKTNQISNLTTFFLSNADHCSLNITVTPFTLSDSILEVTCHFIDKTFLYRDVALACCYTRKVDEIGEKLEKALKNVTNEKVIFVAIDLQEKEFGLPGYIEDIKPDLESVNKENSQIDNAWEDKIQDCLSSNFEKIHTASVTSMLCLVLKDGLNRSEVSNIIRKASLVLSLLPDVLQRDEGQVNHKWIIQSKYLLYLLEKLDENDHFQASLHLLENNQLSPSEIKSLHELSIAIRPFEDYVEVLQKGTAAAGMVIPAIIDICNQLTDMTIHFTTWMAAVAEHLKELLNQQFANVMNDMMFQLASALDPRFKLAWCLDNSMKNSVRSLLIAEASSIFKNEGRNSKEDNCHSSASLSKDDSDSRSSDSEAISAISVYQKRPRLFGSLPLGNPPVSHRRRLDSSEQEVLLYLDEPVLSDIESKPLEYWRFQSMRYPRLASLASKVLCIPTHIGKPNTIAYHRLRQEYISDLNARSVKTVESILMVRKNVHLMYGI